METREIKIKLITKMLGTAPKDPEVYKIYIESKKPVEIKEDESATVEKVETKGWTGFHVAKDGELFIYEYMIKGFLKNAENILKDILKIKALKSKIDNFIYIAPRRISLGAREPDGILERPLRAMTIQGPRVALVRSDYINAGLIIKFNVTLLPHKEINWETVNELLKYGELTGLGQFRNGGYGRFIII